MSLILLSNDPSEASGLVGSKQNIYKPWSFRNSLTETITIDKDSEVALTSCKIALDGQINITPDAKVFYLYLGELIVGAADTMRNTSTSIPIRIELFPNSTGTVQTNADGVARELTRALRDNLFHAPYIPELQDLEKETRVEVLRDGDGDFVGYKIILTHLTDKDTAETKGNQSIDPEDNISKVTLIQTRCAKDWFSINRRNNPALRKYSLLAQGSGDIRLTPNVTNIGDGTEVNIMATTFFHVANNRPIANTQSLTEFDIQGCMNGVPLGAPNLNIPWICGLSRCCETSQDRTVARPGPPFFQWDWADLDGAGSVLNDMMRGFADYLVVNDGLTLRIFNTNCWGGSVVRAGRGGSLTEMRWQEVDYTEGGTNTNFPTRYNTVTNLLVMAKVKWTVSGNQIAIQLEKGDRSVVDLWKYSANRINAGTPRLRGEQCKPIDIGCQDLQPVMGIYNSGWPAITGGTQDAEDYRIELSAKTSFVQADEYTMDLAEYSPTVRMSYYNNLLQSDRMQFDPTMRALNRRNLLTQPETEKYGSYDASTDKFITCLQPVLITSPSSRYTLTTQANTSKILGMVGLNGIASGFPPWVSDGLDGEDKQTYRLLSSEVPKSLSTKSIFVRLENFAQTSVNAGNGNKSSIIAHLPRFDGQNQTGRLFFEPSNLMYLDLKNVKDMKVNSFDISFVYADESYCTSLVGTSNVVLHIRKKKSV